eukprot:1421532-Rhodomonas_salina.1
MVSGDNQESCFLVKGSFPTPTTLTVQHTLVLVLQYRPTPTLYKSTFQCALLGHAISVLLLEPPFFAPRFETAKDTDCHVYLRFEVSINRRYDFRPMRVLRTCGARKMA